MNIMITRFSRAQVLWQHPFVPSEIFQLCNHKTNVALLQLGISMGHDTFQKCGFVQSLKIPCLFLSFYISFEGQRSHQVLNKDSATVFSVSRLQQKEMLHLINY